MDNKFFWIMVVACMAPLFTFNAARRASETTVCETARRDPIGADRSVMSHIYKNGELQEIIGWKVDVYLNEYGEIDETVEIKHFDTDLGE
jgi:hypothetical protein